MEWINEKSLVNVTALLIQLLNFLLVHESSSALFSSILSLIMDLLASPTIKRIKSHLENLRAVRRLRVELEWSQSGSVFSPPSLNWDWTHGPWIFQAFSHGLWAALVYVGCGITGILAYSRWDIHLRREEIPQHNFIFLARIFTPIFWLPSLCRRGFVRVLFRNSRFRGERGLRREGTQIPKQIARNHDGRGPE